MITIEVNDTIFLEDFEAFCKVLVPLENKLRVERNQEPLSEDEKINLFLELRKKHNVT